MKPRQQFERLISNWNAKRRSEARIVWGTGDVQFDAEIEDRSKVDKIGRRMIGESALLNVRDNDYEVHIVERDPGLHMVTLDKSYPDGSAVLPRDARRLYNILSHCAVHGVVLDTMPDRATGEIIVGGFVVTFPLEQANITVLGAALGELEIAAGLAVPWFSELEEPESDDHWTTDLGSDDDEGEE